ncbi:sugar ABC transporter permease [Kitasatospora phosalacinea]|uniref:Sugar ABC transporter permease n=1 Tax=Kitasatospora phosalacinea TaxID=2065 RepID=A0A9W6V251_9ACTN|nr:sugar ABC transporter permease [Kitasatospora phosalacinea]GLW72754.1 sugar ABC transporter permease [Kitasatospora phosalacinea]
MHRTPTASPTASPARSQEGRTGAPPKPSRPASGPARRRIDGRRWAPLGFLSPFGLLFLLTFVAPICYALYQSLFKLRRSGLGLAPPTEVFTGLSNYADALGDRVFTSSVVRVLLIGAVQVPLMLGLALVLALLLDARRTPGKRFFRLAFFLPYAIPGVIGGLMWSFLYQPDVSPIAGALAHVGLHVDFTSEGALPWSVGNMLTWGWTGYNMIVIHSALKAIPGEFTEAAELDGCTGWRLAWHIKVPMVRPALVMSTVFSVIGTAQLYNEPVIMRAVAPNLAADWTPIMAAQNEVAANNYHAAATRSVILALVIFVLSFGFMRFVNKRGAAL